MKINKVFIYFAFIIVPIAVVLYFFIIRSVNSNIIPAIIDKPLILKKAKSPYHLEGPCIIKKQGKILCEPGVIITFYDTMEIKAYGPVILNGTKSEPIQIIPVDSTYDFLRIRLFGVSDTSYFTSIISRNFSLTLEQSNAIIHNCLFSLYRSNGWPIIHSLYSNIKFDGNNLQNTKKIYVGEGIVAYDGHAEVSNSIINGFPDAIEFSRIQNSNVSNNHILNAQDDAIDLNACRNIEISHNIIYSALDKGISIGSDIDFKADSLHWGVSQNILIRRNLIKHCKTGVAIKDGCTFSAYNNTIYACNQGFNAYRKNKSSGGPKGNFTNNIIDSCTGKSYSIDQFCEIELANCLINGFKPNGKNIIHGDPLFMSVEKNDFRLQPGSPCIGKGKSIENNSVILNIGAY